MFGELSEYQTRISKDYITFLLRVQINVFLIFHKKIMNFLSRKYASKDKQQSKQNQQL